MHANKCIAIWSDLLVLFIITSAQRTDKYRVLSWFPPLRMLGRTWMKLCTAGLQKPPRQKVTHVVDVGETCPLLVRWAPKCICMHLSKQQFSKRKQNSTAEDTTGSWDQIQPDQQRPHLHEQARMENLTDQTSNIKRAAGNTGRWRDTAGLLREQVRRSVLNWTES